MPAQTTPEKIIVLPQTDFAAATTGPASIAGIGALPSDNAVVSPAPMPPTTAVTLPATLPGAPTTEAAEATMLTVDGVGYVRLRELAQAHTMSIVWNGITNTVTLSGEAGDYVITVGENAYTANNAAQKFVHAPINQNGSIYVEQVFAEKFSK
jgi:hypothetical protein